MWSLVLGQAYGAEVLPVERIRFYETGVAWFERGGAVTRETSLLVPASHLDDALKSLVVLGGDAEVGAVTFPTAVADDAARAAAGLASDSAMIGFVDALRVLVGTRVALTSGDEEAVGLLLDLEGPLTAPTEPLPVVQAPQYAVTLLGDDGSVLRTTTDRVTAVRGLDPALTGRLERAAETLTPSRATRARGVDLQLARGGEVRLGYLAEAAVWQVTYRVVAGGGEDSRLQAWALVHNDTDEDWSGVRLELANGEPDSFVDPLAAPRYAAREVRVPDDGLSTVAQLATATPDMLLGASGVGIGYGSLGSAGYGSSASYGAGAAGHGVVLAALKEAEAVETPTQFVYRVARPIDLAAHHTALVPLVHQDVPTEALVSFAPGAGQGRTGLWLSNGTDRTLPDGVVAVLDGGGLAGEARLERLKPGEQQLLTFGAELDVDVQHTQEALPAEPVAVGWDGSAVVVEVVKATTHAIEVVNRSGRPRATWHALALGPQAEVVGDWRTEVDPHVGWTWVVVEAPAGTSTRELRVEEQQQERRDPASVTAEELRAWADAALGERATLEEAADRRDLVDQLDAELADVRQERGRAAAETEAVRGDLASSGTDVLARRIVNLEQELRKLDERIAAAEARRAEAFEDLLEGLGALQAGDG